MNTIDFTQPGGFPLDQGTLDFLQTNTNMIAQVSALCGPLAVLSGCVVTGSQVSNGYVVINNEVLPFVGGALDTKVIIRQNAGTLIYEDNTPRAVQFTRYATFGDDGVTAILWANFKRNKPAGVLARVDDLEAGANTMAGRVANVEQKNTDQDTALNTLSGAIGSVAGRVTNVEQKNTDQDSIISSMSGAIGAAAGRITAVEQKNTDQDTAIDTLKNGVDAHEAAIIDFGQRLSTVELSYVRVLARGSGYYGNADPNQSNTGQGGTVTIFFGKDVGTTGYLVNFSIISASSNPQNDLYHQVMVRSKTQTSFQLYFREVAVAVQSVYVDWMIVPLFD